jgi:AAA15 family ATPase/GTPase
MLIRFRVSNFLSFKDEVEFSMIPGRTKQHSSHIVSGGSGRNDVDLLRAGVIYGANAAGKSNLVRTLGFAKRIVTKGIPTRKSIPVVPFKLDANLLNQPSRFEFEIRSSGKDFLYGFEIHRDQVYREWLHLIKKTTTTTLFERNTDSKKKTTITFGNIEFDDKKDAEFLKFVARGTRYNQLFLTESVDREVKYFENIYEWFEKLAVIYPESRYDLDLDVSSESTKAMVEYLKNVGTGVCGFGLQSISIELELPKELVEEVNKTLKEGEQTSVMESARAQRYLLSKNKQGELSASKFMLRHKMVDCNDEVPFDTIEESDGTIRLMDLLPIVTSPSEDEKVYIIDELDRSLHPSLCYQLIKDFLAKTSNSQIVVTTHESNLLTFDLLRRDEIWFVEKNQQGATALYSMEEFTPRYDKDVQKGYLLGRFGAIPIIGKKPF